MIKIFWRPDWPAGSNAHLVASQLRCSTRASAIGGAATGPTLAGVRAAEEEKRRAARAARPRPALAAGGRTA